MKCQSPVCGWCAFKSLAGLLIVLTGGPPRTFAQDDHWVATWACAPQLTESHNLPPAPGLTGNTLRQLAHVSIGGKQLRARFSNAYGTNPIVMKAVHIALGVSATATSAIHASTDRALAFRGAPVVRIPPGETVVSDPLEFDLPADTNVAVTIYFGETSRAITGHPGSRTTSYIVRGNDISASEMPSAVKTARWYVITGIEVLVNSASRAIVVLGDSITDGRGSTTDANDRWPDNLAKRLLTNAPTAGVSVVNMGIGGNAIFGGLGPAAVDRFDRDVLGQSGVRYLIVFAGVNDIGGVSEVKVPQLTTDLIKAYTNFAIKAKARGIRAYGATITPFGGNGYYTPARETARQTVNHWIRTNAVYDGVIDFDAAVRDTVNPTKFKVEYYSGANASDWLHLNPAGYHALADAIDLNLFVP